MSMHLFISQPKSTIHSLVSANGNSNEREQMSFVSFLIALPWCLAAQFTAFKEVAGKRTERASNKKRISKFYNNQIIHILPDLQQKRIELLDFLWISNVVIYRFCCPCCLPFFPWSTIGQPLFLSCLPSWNCHLPTWHSAPTTVTQKQVKPTGRSCSVPLSVFQVFQNACLRLLCPTACLMGLTEVERILFRKAYKVSKTQQQYLVSSKMLHYSVFFSRFTN